MSPVDDKDCTYVIIHQNQEHLISLLYLQYCIYFLLYDLKVSRQNPKTVCFSEIDFSCDLIDISTQYTLVSICDIIVTMQIKCKLKIFRNQISMLHRKILGLNFKRIRL